MSDPGIIRAAERVASASRALDGAADDLRDAARRRGLLTAGAADALEQEAQRVERFGRVIERLETA
jgi:hypothetical protein